MRLAILEPAGDLPPGGSADRLAPELATNLARSGHDVTLLAAGPEVGGRRGAGGLTVLRRRTVARGLLGRLDYDEGLAGAPEGAWTLVRGHFDVAHALAPADAWAAAGARRLGGPPVVFSLEDAPTRRWLVVRRHRLAMVLAATQGAARVTVPSAAAAAAFRRYLLREPEVLAMPPPAAEGQLSGDWSATVRECERLYRAALGTRDARH